MSSPRTIALAAALAGLTLAAAAAAADERLIGASSDDHLWFVVPPARPNDSIILRHYPRAGDGGFATPGLELGRVSVAMPEAAAAWDDQLWLVLSPQRRAGEETRRQVFTSRMRRHPAFGGYHYDPLDRLEILSSLEGEGRLAGFTGTDRGPVALLVPATGRLPSVRPRGQPDQAPSLRRLEGTRWEAIVLPDDFRGHADARLATAEDGRLVLTEPAPEGDEAIVWWKTGDGWNESRAPLNLARVVRLIRVGPGLVAVATGPSGRVDLSYVRDGAALPLASFLPGSGRWTVLGMRDGPRVVTLGTAGDPLIRRIDPLTGEAGEPVPLTSSRLVLNRIWHLPLLAALTIAAVVFVFLFRPDPSKMPPLPPGLEPASAASRIVAVGVDLIVSGAAVMLLLRLRSPEPLLQLPIWTPDTEAALPALMMIGLTAMHSTLAELASGRTLGKMLAGIRTAALDGGRPRAGAVLIRNLIKLVVLLIPVLVVVALFNPHGQGLADQVARTVVVRPRPEPDRDR